MKNLLRSVTPAEALAVIGMGFFAFGLWEIYPPATFLFIGGALMSPLISSLRGGN